MHRQLLLSDETPTLKALASTGSDPIQACRSQERSTRTLLPQCGLQHTDCNTDHSLVCFARSDCNQRGSIALRNRGTPILRSARFHNQTSCRHLRRLLRKSPTFLPQKFSETLCTAQPWLPSAKDLRHTIGLTPSRPK